MIGHDHQQQPGRTWKVGALAKATGLTVRTLHHYDEIGLLQPSARLAGGHRLYDADDLARLYRIIRLRQLGFPLSQVAEVLAEPEWQLAPAIERHLAETRRRAALASRLCARLAVMAAELARQEHPSPQELFSAVEEMIGMDGSVHGTTGFLMYDDVDAAQEYIVRVFGLAAGQIWKSEEGFTEYGEVRAGEQVIGLHPAGGKSYRSPRSVDAVTGTTVISVDDVDVHYTRTVAAGANIVCEPLDRPYGIREYGASDPEGQIWWFASPLG
ncbi:MAG TPA: MerR family transcriptional regulator [Streptosporangiaceae bacterium]|nr:MerR family transcriptional regulator [Streptosporangiaceae bacterium]